jgi:hypothetical protein
MRTRPFARASIARETALAVALALGPSLAVTGCGGSSAGASAPGNAQNPPYRGELVDVFDDSIEPHAVGLELENRMDPRIDLKLRNRAQSSDMIVRARVSTVTGEVEGPDSGYQIGFRVIERLGGTNRIGEDFNVRVDKHTPAMGIVKSFEGRLVGKTFVLFVKAFSRPDGEREIHFHAASDGPDTIAAVKEAVVLDELK